MKDTIYIRDLRVETIIGIFGWEREVRQQISMDLDFEFDVSVPGKSDSIDDTCLLYTSPSPRDGLLSRMPSSA